MSARAAPASANRMISGDFKPVRIVTYSATVGSQTQFRTSKASARYIKLEKAACVILFGMPKVAYQIGAVEKQAPLQAIAAEIAALTSRNRD